jgi:hypothetical protein
MSVVYQRNCNIIDFAWNFGEISQEHAEEAKDMPAYTTAAMQW